MPSSQPQPRPRPVAVEAEARLQRQVWLLQRCQLAAAAEAGALRAQMLGLRQAGVGAGVGEREGQACWKGDLESRIKVDSLKGGEVTAGWVWWRRRWGSPSVTRWKKEGNVETRKEAVNECGKK